MIRATIKETGLNETITQLTGLRKRLICAVEVWMVDVCDHIKKRSIVNAPISPGDKKGYSGGALRTQIETEVKSYARKVVGEIVSKAFNPDDGWDYALAMHEYQVPSYESPKGPKRFERWGLGPRTASQPSTPEGGAGGKYIERVVSHHIVRYKSLLVQMLDAAASGGDYGSLSRTLLSEGG
jgi:hypothetical protein